jgi:hypothetical protein
MVELRAPDVMLTPAAAGERPDHGALRRGVVQAVRLSASQYRGQGETTPLDVPSGGRAAVGAQPPLSPVPSARAG